MGKVLPFQQLSDRNRAIASLNATAGPSAVRERRELRSASYSTGALLGHGWNQITCTQLEQVSQSCYIAKTTRTHGAGNWLATIGAFLMKAKCLTQRLIQILTSKLYPRE